MGAISIIFFYIFLSCFSEATNNDNGFTATLFRRDSLPSPLHNPSLSRYHHLTDAFRRSFSRSTTSISTQNLRSPVIPDSGEFLMSLSLGTPPRDFTAFVDTGSDLIWTQCLPCHKCFNQSRPIFNPRRSSSYRHVPCTSGTCRSLLDSRCGPHLRTCTYGYRYQDGSFTLGDLAFDKITIGSFQFPNTVIGCGHQNGGVTFNEATSGIIGLGGGALSLVSQMNKISNVKRRFSYCLPTFFSDTNVTGKINFGQNTIVSEREVVSTPIISKSPESFYYLTLEALSVAKKRFEMTNNNMSFVAEKGNMFIDSGTTLTFLPLNLYNGVVSSLVRVVRGKRVVDPSKILQLCYAARSIDELNIPIITMHFAGSAAVKLLPVNTFIPVTDDVACLTFLPSSSSAVFGNLAQVHFLIEYDLDEKRLSLKRTTCA